MLFSANLLYVGERDDGVEPLWEERIILVDVEDEKEAAETATKLAVDHETSFKTTSGALVSWKFVQVERVFLIDDNLSSGAELFSRFLRQSEVKSMLIPFDDE